MTNLKTARKKNEKNILMIIHKAHTHLQTQSTDFSVAGTTHYEISLSLFFEKAGDKNIYNKGNLAV